MAIYQPTNITPDLVSGPENGVVFTPVGASDSRTVEVSWTVNGNSPLLAYRIEFFRNDAASTAGTDTGKVVLEEPFSPISADGTEQRFSVSLPFGVGGTYFTIAGQDTNKQGKIRITQWWGSSDAQSVVQRSLSVFRLTHRSEISVSGPVLSGGERTFTGNVELPLYALYGDSAVEWARWQIMDTEGNVVQDTGRVWGATSYEWTADQLPSGTYFAVFSAHTSNGETLNAETEQFSVLENASEVSGSVTAVCDKANRAVRITARDTIPIQGNVYGGTILPGGGMIFPEDDGHASWELPEITDGDWGFAWRGRVSGEGANPIFTMTLKNGETVSFGIGYNSTMQAYVPIYTSPAAQIQQQPPQTLEDGEDILVSFSYRSAGTYGWVFGAYDSRGNYDAVNWVNVPFSSSVPVKVELFSGGETKDFYICFGADSISAIGDYVTSGVYELPQGTTVGLNVAAFTMYAYLFGPQMGLTIWRQKTGSSTLTKIATFLTGSANYTYLDYGAANGNEYSYLVAVETDGSGIIQRSETVSPCFWDWALIEAVKNDGDKQNAYRAENVYFFGMNLSSGSNGNGNAPNVLSNFTPYPTVLRDTQNRHSGTLTALIGSVSAPGEYTDNNALRDAIRALSVTQNTLFLRNRRGDFLKIAIAGEITTDTADTSYKQQINASIPWVEIGPADGTAVSLLSGGDSD